MAGVDHQIGDARRPQGVEVVDDQRFASDQQQRLGGMIGQRAHPFTAPSGKNHRLHDAGVQRSRFDELAAGHAVNPQVLDSGGVTAST
jgi:hypothetical protein